MKVLSHQILFLLFLFSTISVYSQDEKKSILLQRTNLFGEKAFIENRGQFTSISEPYDTVRYVFEQSDLMVCLFDNKVEYISKKSNDKSGTLNKVTAFFGNSAKSQIVEQEALTYYFSYGSKKYNSKGFRRLVYKEIYPNVDLVFHFPNQQKDGFEYSFILRKNAKVSDIEIKYLGADTLFVDFEGNLKIVAGSLALTEHKPYSIDKEKNEIATTFNLKDFTLNYSLEGIEILKSDQVEIDPWVSSTMTGPNNITGYDVDYDNFDNLYVYGGDPLSNDCKVAKYDMVGNLQWVFQGTAPPSWFSGGALGYAGNFVVNRATGDIFIGQPRSTSPAEIISIDAMGNFTGFTSNTATWFDEIWDMGYNVCTNDIFAFGGSNTAGTTNGVPLGGSLNLSTGNVNTSVFFPGQNNHAMASHAIDDQGNIYGIIGDGSSAMVNTVFKTNSSFSTLQWSVVNPSGNLLGLTNKGLYQLPKNSVGYNCLAVNNYYLFYFDGKNLCAFNKSNGTLIGTRSLTHMVPLTTGGIVADDCNNVFVGGIDSVMCFNFSVTANSASFVDEFARSIPLQLQPNIGTPGRLYDLKFDRTKNNLYVCGSGFAGVYNLPNQTCFSFAARPTCTSSEVVIEFDDQLNLLNATGCANCPTIGLTYQILSSPGMSQIYSSINSIVNQHVVNLNTGNYLINASLFGTCPLSAATSFQSNFTMYPLLSCNANLVTSNQISIVSTASPNVFTAAVCSGFPFTLNGGCTAGTTWNWSWGDGTPASNTQNPSHTYANNGTYTLQVTALTDPSCPKTQTIVVSVGTCGSGGPSCCTNISMSGLPQFNLANLTANACPQIPFTLGLNCQGALVYTVNFGDQTPDQIIVGQNITVPAHAYQNSGTYNLSIKAGGPFCVTNSVVTVNVAVNNCPACCLNPSFLLNSGITSNNQNPPTWSMCSGFPLGVLANCVSNQSPIYKWDFGDNSSIFTGPLVNHTYGVGNFVITLTIQGTSCYQVQNINVNSQNNNCQSCCPSIGISGLPNFNATNMTASGCILTPVTLGAACTTANSFTVYWGDGQQSIQQSNNSANLQHQYQLPNTYNITVIAANATCYSTQNISLNMSASNCPSCCNSIILNSLSNYNPGTNTAQLCLQSPISFAPSCGVANSYTVVWGDGQQSIGGVQTYQHQYQTANNYNLQIVASDGTCLTNRQIIVNVSNTNCNPCCNNGFVTGSGSQSVTSFGAPVQYSIASCLGLPLNLSALCGNNNIFSWAFGDGSTATGANSSHTYLTGGTYQLTVTATGPGCANSQIIDVVVSYSNCPSCCNGISFNGTGFNYLIASNTPTVYNAGICPSTFFNLVANNCGSANTYIWDFGDGSPVTNGQTSSHQYNTPGTYTISLKAIGVGCFDESRIVVVVSYANCGPCCNSGFVTSNGVYNLQPTGNPNIFTGFACPNTQVSFNASSCSAGTSFTWQLGNSQNAVIANNASTYYNPGTYTITVAGTGNSCLVPTQTIVLNVTASNIVAPPASCSGIINLSANACLLSGGLTFAWNFGDGSSGTGANVSHNYANAGSYVVTLLTYVGTVLQNQYTHNLTVQACQPPQQCKDCIGSFEPGPGDYLLSVWVREDVSVLPINYNNPRVKISFTGNNAVYTFGTNVTKNKVVNGWQKIEETFSVPANATHLNLELINLAIAAAGSKDVYFDDIRIIPTTGQMKTYVYDPVSLKLTAVLDENNFATYYEYDEEGNLVRTKKETEKGVMTIQENRQNLKNK